MEKSVKVTDAELLMFPVSENRSGNTIPTPSALTPTPRVYFSKDLCAENYTREREKKW